MTSSTGPRGDLPSGPRLAEAVVVIRNRLATQDANRRRTPDGTPEARQLDERIATLRKAEELLARQAVALGDASALARWPAADLQRLRGLSLQERTDAGSLVAARQVRALRGHRR